MVLPCLPPIRTRIQKMTTLHLLRADDGPAFDDGIDCGTVLLPRHQQRHPMILASTDDRWIVAVVAAARHDGRSTET